MAQERALKITSIELHEFERFDGIDEAGCVSVPAGPVLGVCCDWDFIAKHTVASQTFS